MEYKHISVLLNECIEGLNIKDNGVYFDGTFGLGGHTKEILKLGNTKVIATDLDLNAIEYGKKLSSQYDNRLTLVHDNFKNFTDISDRLNISCYDGILLDLGFSSPQVDDKSRGFSYLADDEKLDMRMDITQEKSAYTIINGYSLEDLSRIFKEYGEEKFHYQIAANIVKKRSIKPITTCGELNQIIDQSIPSKFKQDGHPSKRTYQALRIEVNGELDGLYEAILTMGERLTKGGRLAVITFHSLEDRIVKSAFKYLESDCICDKSLPVCVCGKKQIVKIITAKPITSGLLERDLNPRAKSAKLRICERV